MNITISGKEYESGKITRKKYAKYTAVYKELVEKEESKLTYTEEELDKMIQAIVDVFGDQFTFEEAVECEEMQTVANIIYYFAAINAEVLSELNEKAKERNLQVNQGKNLKGMSTLK